MANEKESPLNVEIKAPDSQLPLGDFPINIESQTAFNFLMQAVEANSDELYWVDPDGQVIHANRSSCRNMGYDYCALVGKYIWELDPLFPKDVSCILARDTRQETSKI